MKVSIKKLYWFLTFVFVGGVALALYAAETSQVIPYSSSLAGQGGTTQSLVFKIYNNPSGTGAPVFQDQPQNVDIQPDDSFSANVGDGTAGGIPADVFVNNPSLYITFVLASDPNTNLATPTPITSSGYAHFALGVPDNAVTTAKIQDMAVTGAKIEDSAITSAKIAAGSVDSSKIVDGSIGTSQVDPNQVQRRVGSCDVGNAIQGVNADGTVTCQAVGTGTIGGSGIANVVPKFTGETTIGNSSISEVGGKVGIGTTAPTAKLDVQGGAATGVFGQSTNNVGVKGVSTNNIGVNGFSTNFIGVQGNTFNPNRPGVQAEGARPSVCREPIVSPTRISVAMRRQVRERAGNRCEYCWLAEEHAFFSHEADHIIAEKHGGKTCTS